MPLFQTDDAVAGTLTYYVIPVDSSEFCYSAFQNALMLLTNPDNWDTTGLITPDSAAELMSLSMENQFVFPNPVGMIFMTGQSAATLAPAALPCNGAAVQKTVYPELFAAIGYTFGGLGNYFQVPDLRARFPIGVPGTVLGTAIVAGSGGGAESVVQTQAMLATHTHAGNPHSHSEVTATPTLIAIGPGAPAASALPGIGVTGVATQTVQNTGSNTAIPTTPKYTAVYFAIVTGKAT